MPIEYMDEHLLYANKKITVNFSRQYNLLYPKINAFMKLVMLITK